jgi:hypothetical protein
VVMSLPCLEPASFLPDWMRQVAGQDARAGALTRDVRLFVRVHPGAASFLDLAGHACPGGRFDASIRRDDGVHFSENGAAATWKWLFRKLGPLATRD